MRNTGFDMNSIKHHAEYDVLDLRNLVFVILRKQKNCLNEYFATPDTVCTGIF